MEIIKEEIDRYLVNPDKVIVLDEIDSTNEEVKRLEAKGEPSGLVVISRYQMKGKGRIGRGFYSPKGSGIYMSILLPAKEDSIEDTLFITTIASVAVSRAISEICKTETDIKWVNDIYYNNKKICGILTESISDQESNAIKKTVTGIGINVFKPGTIPDELLDVMGYIFDNNNQDFNVNKFCAAIINYLHEYYDALPDKTFLDEYKKRSFVIGKRISFGTPSGKEVVPGDDWESGMAVDIDDTCGLVVRMDDGSLKTLNTGEISVRLK